MNAYDQVIPPPVIGDAAVSDRDSDVYNWIEAETSDYWRTRPTLSPAKPSKWNPLRIVQAVCGWLTLAFVIFFFPAAFFFFACWLTVFCTRHGIDYAKR